MNREVTGSGPSRSNVAAIPHSPSFWATVFKKLPAPQSLALGQTCQTALRFLQIEGWRSIVPTVHTFFGNPDNVYDPYEEDDDYYNAWVKGPFEEQSVRVLSVLSPTPTRATCSKISYLGASLRRWLAWAGPIVCKITLSSVRFDPAQVADSTLLTFYSDFHVGENIALILLNSTDSDVRGYLSGPPCADVLRACQIDWTWHPEDPTDTCFNALAGVILLNEDAHTIIRDLVMSDRERFTLCQSPIWNTMENGVFTYGMAKRGGLRMTDFPSSTIELFYDRGLFDRHGAHGSMSLVPFLLGAKMSQNPEIVALGKRIVREHTKISDADETED